MPKKEIGKQKFFDEMKPSLIQYADFVDQSDASSQHIYDEIINIEERYIERSIVDQGGMKKVLKTTDTLTNRPVAKATLIDCEDPEKNESFLKEARLTAALEHPNIIPVYDIGVDDADGPFFTMKLVDGQNLSSILKNLSTKNNDSQYNLQYLMEIFLKICDAIAYAHSRGIVHLDLKPENIQVGDYGEVLVCDWGLAKIITNSEEITGLEVDLDPHLYNNVTLDGYIRGTPGYMAPEQIDTDLGPRDQRTDIYALGGILYSLLTLKAPLKSDVLTKTLEDTLRGNIVPPSERVTEGRLIPPSLEAVAMKALEVKPELRYSSVSDLRQEIQKWMGGFATDAENASFTTSLWLLLKRHKVVSSLILIMLVSTIAAFIEIKANEKKAIANEKKAILSERKSKQTLNLYLKEKDLTNQISEHAIGQLKVINDFHLDNLHFDKALDFIDKTLVFQPDHEMMNAMKGETHFYCQEYDKALIHLAKAGKNQEKQPYKKMLELAPVYSQLIEGKDFLKAADLANLIFSFDDQFRWRIFSYEAKKIDSEEEYKAIVKDPKKLPFLKNQMELYRLLLIRDHSKNLHLNYKYFLEDDGISFDFSNSMRLDRYKFIMHLPLVSLNLENTPFWRQWIFSHYHLKSVNIINTRILKISYTTLKNTSLKEIILTKDQFDQSNPRSTVNKINFIIKE